MQKILNDCKDEVARKYGWKNWDELSHVEFTGAKVGAFTEAAILAMQRVAELINNQNQ